MPTIELDTLLELVGSLNDSNEPESNSDRFRKYLRENLTASGDVRSYIERALSQTGDQYNKALQDLVNHVGQLLGFKVTFGRYRGVRSEIGFDGLWQSPHKSQAIVVETKTTDTYTIRTASLLGYINALVSEGVLSDATSALGLYVMGRFDTATNQLENAIIVEGRREQLRVVSVLALVSLLELKQEYHLAHETVLDLLLPSPIKIDPIIELIHNVVAQEQERDDLDTSEAPTTVEETQPEEAPQQTHSATRKNYTGSQIQAVILDGHRVPVHTWREALEAVMSLLIEQNAARFQSVASEVVGRKRPYITTNPDLLRVAKPVSGTDLYFESNISAEQITRIAQLLVEKMGYKREALKFETE